jgi:hypothetical protein
MKWPKYWKEYAIPKPFNPMEVPVRILRKMGYKSDSQGIIDRFIRVNGAWEGHLQHTRSFILKTITGKKIENLVVYGSGWGLDLPLDELSGIAGHVMLYDLVHPAQVIHRLRKYKNVSAIQADITGGAVIRAYRAVKQYKRHGQKASPENICAQAFQPDVDPDFTISLNILSQIGIMITDYLKLYVPYDQEEIDRINCLLQQSHLQLLMPGKSCLITDVKEFCYNDANQLVEATDTVNCPFPQSGFTESWDWQLDPLREYKPGYKTVSHVVAIEP